ncbi:hypothetical protein LCGC14_2299570 [marine sediment metagenome]|uniref:Uncharacterized protein n=1 Tax=marine sediment metagenome TaxID=412755 RepID=A0A0F9DBE3_9ZZZZ
MRDPIITRSVSSELYRRVNIDCDHVDSYHHEIVYEKVEPDATMQAIADEPRCEHGNVYSHIDGKESYERIRQGSDYSWCKGSPELAALLDAITKENNHE